MPFYTFTNPKTRKDFLMYMSYSDYDLVERDERGNAYLTLDDGTHCFRNLGADLGSAKIQSDAWVGQESTALAIHPDQIKEEKEYASKRGVDIDFNPKNGRPKFRDRKNRKEYCKLRGVVDYEGGFGDSI